MLWGGGGVDLSNLCHWYDILFEEEGGVGVKDTINNYKCHLGNMCGILEYLAQPFQCDCHLSSIILLSAARYQVDRSSACLSGSLPLS